MRTDGTITAISRRGSSPKNYAILGLQESSHCNVGEANYFLLSWNFS
jgi:hypothetical protein